MDRSREKMNEHVDMHDPTVNRAPKVMKYRGIYCKVNLIMSCISRIQIYIFNF